MALAAIFGFISGSTLFIGALLGMYMNVPKYTLGAVMAFGSGVMVSTLTFDLMENAFLSGGFFSVSIGFLAGTLLFVIGDYLIDHFGGSYRKHGHGKLLANKKSSKKVENSGSAILLGAILDGIPESLAIGIGLAAGQGVGFSMMIAVFLSNFPEGVSGAQGMKSAGKSNRYIMLVWGITIATSVFAAVLGYVFLGNASKEVIAVTLSLAAGSILAMLADTMMPEAFDEGGRFIALATALGFFVAFVVSHLTI